MWLVSCMIRIRTEWRKFQKEDWWIYEQILLPDDDDDGSEKPDRWTVTYGVEDNDETKNTHTRTILTYRMVPSSRLGTPTSTFGTSKTVSLF